MLRTHLGRTDPRHLVALLLLCLGLGVAAAPARADLDPPAEDFFALNVQDLFAKFTVAQRATLLSGASAKGFRAGRMDVRWDLVEPAAPVKGTPAYSWGVTDSVITELAKAGIRWEPIFDTTPTWASGGSTIFAPPL